MEPKDIDNIIRGKVLESSDLHEQEMDSAKSFIWTKVQNKTSRKRLLTWYHLAAAIILLLVCFSFVFYIIQERHNNEMSLLSKKIDLLQKNHVSQEKLLKSKDQEMESLGDELKQVEQKFTSMLQQKPLAQKETLVYRTDTVYLKQIEYITAVTDPINSKEISANKTGMYPRQHEDTKEKEIDEAIYPSKLNMGKTQQSEPIVFKFGSLTARKD